MSSTPSASHGASIPTHYTDKENNMHHHCGHHHVPRTHIQKPHQSMVSQVYDPPFYRVANPGPLGLISFALTTFVLGLYQCGAG